MEVYFLVSQQAPKPLPLVSEGETQALWCRAGQRQGRYARRGLLSFLAPSSRSPSALSRALRSAAWWISEQGERRRRRGAPTSARRAKQAERRRRQGRGGGGDVWLRLGVDAGANPPPFCPRFLCVRSNTDTRLDVVRLRPPHWKKGPSTLRPARWSRRSLAKRRSAVSESQSLVCRESRR